MPLFYNLFPLGYDLDLEMPFTRHDGEKVYVNSHCGALVLGCRVCGATRDRMDYNTGERCWDGHGPMRPVRLPELEHYAPLWEARGEALFPLEERRALRLAREWARPDDWVFGDKTEADFPLGYVKTFDVRTLVGPSSRSNP